MQLTIWASLVDGNDGLLVGWVDGLEGLSLLSLYPLAIDVQAEGLLVGDAGGFDLSCERHDCRVYSRTFWYWVSQNYRSEGEERMEEQHRGGKIYSLGRRQEQRGVDVYALALGPPDSDLL